MAVSLSLCFAFFTILNAQDNRPNVLFISIDDLRPELGCYESRHIQSPNIDTFAKQGIVFERAYCQVSVCGPSRASLLTGIRPDKRTCKIWNADKYAPNAVTLPQAFREAGYHTISNSKIFHGPEEAAKRSWSETPTGHDNHMDFFDPATKSFMKSKTGPFFYRRGETQGLSFELSIRRFPFAGKQPAIRLAMLRPMASPIRRKHLALPW